MAKNRFDSQRVTENQCYRIDILVHWLIQSHGHCNFHFAQFKLAQYCFFRMGDLDASKRRDISSAIQIERQNKRTTVRHRLVVGML